MKLRAILRGFIRWQIKEDLFKNIIIDYEIAERYLEETEKSLKDYGVLDDVIYCGCDNIKIDAMDYENFNCLNCNREIKESCK